MPPRVTWGWGSEYKGDERGSEVASLSWFDDVRSWRSHQDGLFSRGSFIFTFAYTHTHRYSEKTFFSGKKKVNLCVVGVGRVCLGWFLASHTPFYDILRWWTTFCKIFSRQISKLFAWQKAYQRCSATFYRHYTFMHCCKSNL